VYHVAGTVLSVFEYIAQGVDQPAQNTEMFEELVAEEDWIVELNGCSSNQCIPVERVLLANRQFEVDGTQNSHPKLLSKI
jgi:hypothetical protein